jgi:hypothetical protein
MSTVMGRWVEAASVSEDVTSGGVVSEGASGEDDEFVMTDSCCFLGWRVTYLLVP